jgi:hypothetical protein
MKFILYSIHTLNFVDKIKAKGTYRLVFKVNGSKGVKDIAKFCLLSISYLNMSAHMLFKKLKILSGCKNSV